MSDEPPQVIIIARPNGAGKTTLAPFLLRDRFGRLHLVNAYNWTRTHEGNEGTTIEWGRRGFTTGGILTPNPSS